jgi:hypothetical protein
MVLSSIVVFSTTFMEIGGLLHTIFLFSKPRILHPFDLAPHLTGCYRSIFLNREGSYEKKYHVSDIDVRTFCT